MGRNKIVEEIDFEFTPQTEQHIYTIQQSEDSKKELEKSREKREKEDEGEEDILIIIDGAKIKMGIHLGTFSVFTDTPTIQGKTVGTVVEKQLLNFSFKDGFKLMSIMGDWLEVGTAKFQDNYVLLKKSKIMAMGKMPGNTPPETGMIEFIDSGQINIPENINTDGLPVPDYVPTPKVIDFFLTDENDVRVEGGAYDEPIFLHIKTVGFINKKATIKLEDSKVDYYLKGVKLEGNIIKDYLITQNEEIIKLDVKKPIEVI